jgi:cytochrome bd-type quinol oxidase subunit 2
VVYATLFSAFYLRLLLMLAGLILRGVAFEYRYKTEQMRWVWDAGFAGGSFVAAFIQGMTVGALVEGLPIVRLGRDRLIAILATPTPTQRRALDLLGVTPTP